MNKPSPKLDDGLYLQSVFYVAVPQASASGSYPVNDQADSELNGLYLLTKIGVTPRLG